ncbi:MAG TPA: DUF2934 domain-containing protein [Candidatus Baltobacteraceae bacterium]|jgi:hypothetical protein|nr:DUF2934 domain-containing protein [Candidatus Baltobacteraceae bacterium]
MNRNQISQDQEKTPSGPSRAIGVAESRRGETELMPSPDEVARRAYFTYVNQGSLPGHEVQHWLAAEAELIAERNLTRVHGYHNRT